MMSVQITELERQVDHQVGRFSTEDLQFFRQNGFIVVRNLADPKLIQHMREVAIDGLLRQTAPVEYEAEFDYPGSPISQDAEGGETIRRLKQALSRHFAFMQFVSDPSLVSRLRQLLGTDVMMPLAHHNCIMTKQPRFSSDTNWHQDIRYWSFQRPELVSVWLALGKEFPNNGSLKLIPQSHWIDIEPDRFDEALFLRPELPANRELIERSVTVELEAGDTLFFHCRTFHAASRNHTDEPKLSVVFTFRPLDNPPISGTRSASLPELLLPGQTDSIPS